MALIELGQKNNAVREFAEVVRRYPGTEETPGPRPNSRNSRRLTAPLGSPPHPTGRIRAALSEFSALKSSLRECSGTSDRRCRRLTSCPQADTNLGECHHPYGFRAGSSLKPLIFSVNRSRAQNEAIGRGHAQGISRSVRIKCGDYSCLNGCQPLACKPSWAAERMTETSRQTTRAVLQLRKNRVRRPKPGTPAAPKPAIESELQQLRHCAGTG